jgi:hypothetical protein
MDPPPSVLKSIEQKSGSTRNCGSPPPPPPKTFQRTGQRTYLNPLCPFVGSCRTHPLVLWKISKTWKKNGYFTLIFLIKKTDLEPTDLSFILKIFKNPEPEVITKSKNRWYLWLFTYLSMKECSLFVLFCHVEISPNHGTSCHALGTIEKPSITSQV